MRTPVRQDPAVVLVHGGHHPGGIGVPLGAGPQPQGRRRGNARRPPGDLHPGRGARGLRDRRPSGPANLHGQPASHLRRPGNPHRRIRPRRAHQPGPLRSGAQRPHAPGLPGVPRRQQHGGPRGRRRALLVLLHRAARPRGHRIPHPRSRLHDGRGGAAVLLAGLPPDAPGAPPAEGRRALRQGRPFGAREFYAPRRTGPACRRLRPHGRTHRNAAGRRAPPAARHFPRAALAPRAPGRGRRAGALGRRPQRRAQPHPEGIRPAQRPGRPASAGDARRGRPEFSAPPSRPPRRAGASNW